MKTNQKSAKLLNPESAFTLIELLVVVAIIAVLVAILLPALQQARTHAKTVACLSNYHQLGIGVRAYMNDFGDRIPLPLEYMPGSTTVVKEYWQHKVYPYVGADKVFNDQAAIGELDPWGNQINGCGINTYWFVGNTHWSRHQVYHPSIVDVPSREVLFADNKGDFGVVPILDTLPPDVRPNFLGDNRARMSSRHAGSPNVLFLDLHAEHISPSTAQQWSNFFVGNNFWPPLPCWLPDWN